MNSCRMTQDPARKPSCCQTWAAWVWRPQRRRRGQLRRMKADIIKHMSAAKVGLLFPHLVNRHSWVWVCVRACVCVWLMFTCVRACIWGAGAVWATVCTGQLDKMKNGGSLNSSQHTMEVETGPLRSACTRAHARTQTHSHTHTYTHTHTHTHTQVNV